MTSPDYTRFTVDGYDMELEIGINPSEIGVRQKIRLQASVEVDNSLTHIPDTRMGLREGYDYNHLVQAIQDACHEPVHLLETLAQRIVERLLTHPKVMACEVIIQKFHMWPNVASVAISLRRTRALTQQRR